MNSIQFWGAIEIGLIYGLVALGVYLSFRILDFPDLTADGSFSTGTAISGMMILSGYGPVAATLLAVVGGLLAGSFTAWLNVRWNILNLLASILTMTALYSINLRIMGFRPNLSLLNETSIFTWIEEVLEGFDLSPLFIGVALGGVVSSVVMLALYGFLRSEYGLAMRATGKNTQMAIAQGIRTKGMIIAGIALSNGIIALAGALFAQNQGFSDAMMGQGTIVFGLASVLIGEALMPSRFIFVTLVSCLGGAITYRLVLAFALNTDALGLETSDLNLVTAALVALVLILSSARNPLSRLFPKRKALS